MNQKPQFDRDKAEYLMGKYILVGITYYTPALVIEARKQVHGVVVGFDPQRGLKMELKGWGNGQEYWLPTAVQSFDVAPLGKYKLVNTDEEIENPDFIVAVSMVKKTPGGEPLLKP